MKNKYVKSILIVALVILCAYLLLDYFNIPYLMGMKISNINTDVFSIVISNLIIVLIAIITYFLIDARSIAKENNAKYVLSSLLIVTYDLYDTFLPIIDKVINSEHIEDKEIFNQHQIKYFLESPLEYDSKIIEGAVSGNIKTEFYKAYMEIKMQYELIITLVNIKNFELCKTIIKNMKEKMEIERKNIEEYQGKL